MDDLIKDALIAAAVTVAAVIVYVGYWWMMV